MDLHGRGFLGFRMIRTWESEQAVETETLFRHDERVNTAYPYAFLPARIMTAIIGAPYLLWLLTRRKDVWT